MNKVWKGLFFEQDKFSPSLFWKNIVYLVATLIIYKMGETVSWEMMALYMTVVAADNRAGAIIKARFNSKDTTS